MDLRLRGEGLLSGQRLHIGGSKSETNRLLLLQALFPQIRIENASDSDDARAMQQAVSRQSGTIDIGHAGTAMRFLTAYFAATEGAEVVLTGSARMQQRPIAILVEALRNLGADIAYLENEGFPPLRISGRRLKGGAVTLRADVSSQYISALLLVAANFDNGIELRFEGEITSLPYVEMTLELLRKVGIAATFDGHVARVGPAANVRPVTLTVESDWSSASYHYSLIALSQIGATIELSAFTADSLQGDRALVELYRHFGVETEFRPGPAIRLTKTSIPTTQTVRFDLKATPDIAQTIAVTAFGLGMGCDLSGLHTLKIKETDRLWALQTELGKLGARVRITADSLHLQASDTIISGCSVDTYDDHRMAMAFAPLAVKTELIIRDAEVVSKSYLGFWEDMRALGIRISTVG